MAIRTTTWVLKLAQHMSIKTARGLDDFHKRFGSPQFHFQDPFDPVLRPVWELPSLPKYEKEVVGAGMIVLGTGMLLPGPLDGFIAAGGFAVGGPWGAVAAVAIYNITAIGIIIVGYLMVMD